MTEKPRLTDEEETAIIRRMQALAAKDMVDIAIVEDCAPTADDESQKEEPA